MARSWLARGGGLVFLAILAISAVVDADHIFYDSFDDSWDGRWIVSESDDYKGTWQHAESEGHGDYGLLVSEEARKYGIAVDLPKTVDFKDGEVVLQYDLRLQSGLQCGGAYLKYLLPQEAGWTPSQFDSSAPYSIMFGPDKCGSTNKVHFIFRHKSPKTGEYVEHHLKNPPAPIVDKLSHVYTAVIYPNNTLAILIDGEERKTADLLHSDFEPSVVPPKTIPDPEDIKPEDWDERAKISDPEATKPDDWDETQPKEIEDLEAVKPEGWLDDEPDEIYDPEAVKPEDWDEEEDGEWEAPKILNPVCEEAPGCGEWVRPFKRNPDYKGKWTAPLIDNPAYKGIWKPREIDNPDFFELERPDIEPIAAIGIEIWTMQSGILFDNILITQDKAEAEEYREKTWRPKFDAEKEKEEKEEELRNAEANPGIWSSVKDAVFNILHKLPELPVLALFKSQITDILEKVESHKDITVGGILGAMAIVVVVLVIFLIGGKKKKTTPVSVAKKEDISTADDDVAEKESEKVSEPLEGTVENAESAGEIEKEEESAATRRRIRRET